MIIKKLLMIFVFFIFCFNLHSEVIKLARLKYSGGSDWYNDPDVLINLAHFINQNTSLKVEEKEYVVDLKTDDIFNYKFIYMTGHGNVHFTKKEIENLRTYLDRGGFLYVDDDYGLDKSFREEIKKVFPESPLKLISEKDEEKLFNMFYKFKSCPKIHEHYKGSPQIYVMKRNGKIVVLYTYNTNISDGWASEEVHNDPLEKRLEALKFGVNILLFSIFH